ncbi:MAG TPA: prolyl oligopeptidase family serine peptidase [Candidatus Acidoferrum sp.]|nr:prolyl oligopeptidase family serine peptidase [Candidatus Acidoferrum sp.]
MRVRGIPSTRFALLLTLFGTATGLAQDRTAISGQSSFAPMVAIQHQDYAKARRAFHTKLLRQGPAPQSWHPLTPPAGAFEVEYLSGVLRLKAWMHRPTSSDKRRYPAILFLHGGHAFGMGDWQDTQPFRDASFVVMAPMLRGENGQAGTYTMFYDEVEDAIAAAEYLRHQSYVDTARIYVAGPSVGGTMAMLAAMVWRHFRAAASFSGSPDQALFVKYAPGAKDYVPFDSADPRELETRSPLAYAASFKCPVRIYYGSQEPYFDLTSKRTAEIAREHNVDAQAVMVEGGHVSEVPRAEAMAIEFFLQARAR